MIILQFLFLYGIAQESLCLSSSYATFVIIGIVIAVVEANTIKDDPEDAAAVVGSSAAQAIWAWLYLIWIVFTNIVALIYVIDLMRMQREFKISNRLTI